MKWIRTSDDNLPEEGKYVLCKHNRRTWYSKTDLKGVNSVVLKLVKGISLLERAELDDSNPKKNIFSPEDEHGNNSKPYCWEAFGQGRFNGQEIIWWSYIDDVPYEEPKPENVVSYEDYKKIFKMTDEEIESTFTDECWLMFYRSRESEALGSPSFTPGKELKASIIVNREMNKRLNEILWKK